LIRLVFLALVVTRLNTPTQEQLHYQLKVWGYYSTQIELYSQLIHRLSPKENGSFLHFLGTAHYSLGNYQQVIAFFEQSLEIFQALNDEFNSDLLLSSLGGAYYALGNYPKAIEYQERWLAITQDDEDATGKGIALGSLGNIYEALGDYFRALDYHRQHLAIAQAMTNLEHEGSALGNIGSVYIVSCRDIKKTYL
jgi:tetratricopeptide (TPR) repeat protein